MAITIIKLMDLLDTLGLVPTLEILKSFKSLPNHDTGEVNEVEDFLHSKAIHFEKNSLSTTQLVFSEYKGDNVLVGYYSLANKPLIISKKNFNKLSESQKKKFRQHGVQTESGGLQIYSYLIGQLGKNYSEEALNTGAITGQELLTLAYDDILKVKQVISAKYVWIECLDKERLVSFYRNFGFKKIEGYESVKDNVVMIMKLK